LRQFVDFWHFFEWGQCRWLLAYEEKGRSCSRPVAQHRRSQLVNHIPPRWGNARLSDLDGVRIEQWLLDLPLANQTRKHIRGTLNIVLKTARRQKLIQHNPIYDADPLANRWIETGALPFRSCTSCFRETRLNGSDSGHANRILGVSGRDETRPKTSRFYTGLYPSFLWRHRECEARK